MEGSENILGGLWSTAVNISKEGLNKPTLQLPAMTGKLLDPCIWKQNSWRVESETGFDIKKPPREEPRWRRNRTGRPLSLLQIRQKNNKHRANFTKQLLIASWGHQAPRKATHCLRKEVGQNIKDKKRDKRAKDRDPSGEGSLNRGSFQTPGNPRTGGSGGSFWISEDNLTGRGTINKTHRLRA